MSAKPVAQSTGVAAGTYNSPTLTVDAQGVIQSIASYSPIGIPVYILTTAATGGVSAAVNTEGTGNGSLSITPVLGQSLIIEACGVSTRTASATGTFTLKKGSTTLISGSPQASAAGSATLPWSVYCLLTFLSTTTVIGQGQIYSQLKYGAMTATVAVTVSSAAETISLQWGGSAAVSSFASNYFTAYYQ